MVRRRRVLFVVATAVVAGAVAAPTTAVSATGSDLSAEVDAEFAMDVRFRTSAGLRADVPYIDNVRAQHARSNRFLRHGIVLTPDEEKELDARAAVTATAVTPILTWVKERADVGYGGMYMNQSTGKLTILVTSEPDNVRAQIRDVSGQPDRVDVVRVERSLHELLAVKAAVVAARGTTDGYRIHGVGLEQRTNRVRVGVEGDLERALQDLQARFGPGLVVYPGTEIQSLAGMTTGSSVSQAPPFRGGQSMARSSTISCVQGFIGRDLTANPTAYYSIGAGHCGGPGTAWYHPTWALQNYPVGQVTRNSLSSTSTTELADAMAIRISSSMQSNDVVITWEGGSYNYNINITSRETWAQSVEGEERCYSDVHAPKYDCGHIVDASRNSCYAGSYPAGHAVCYDYLREVDIEEHPGDSGSPTMQPIDGFGNARAAGVLVAADGPGTFWPHSYFAQIHDVLQELAPMELMLTTL